MEMGNEKVVPIPLGFVKVFLIKGEKNILVDTGVAGKEEVILKGLLKNNIEPKDISMIIITHNHGDHVGGLSKLKEATGAKVVVHECEADALSKGETIPAHPMGRFGKILVRFFGHSGVKPVRADILVKEELDLAEYGIKGKIVHTPGHTPGSLSVILHGGAAIVGDILSGKRNKAGGKAVLPIFADNLRILKKSLISIVGFNPVDIFPAHGTFCSRKAVEGLIEELDKKAL